MSTWLILLCLQDIPKISWEKTAPLFEFIGDLDGEIWIDSSIDQKELTIFIKEAWFFEALDAVCRAHGNVRYFVPGDYLGREIGLRLLPQPWVEIPSAYSGHFKFVIRSMSALRSMSSRGDLKGTCVNVLLFGPPSCRVDVEANPDVQFAIEEAVDHDGKNVLPSKEIAELNGSMVVDEGNPGGNTRSQTLFLGEFDIDQGLKLLRGTATVTTRDAVELTIPIELGKRVDVPEGVFTVDAIHGQRFEKQPGLAQQNPTWRIALTFHPNERGAGLESLESLLESRVEFDRVWLSLDLPKKGLSFMIQTWEGPKRMTLRLRKQIRTFTLPFAFRDVQFKKE